MTEPIAQSIPVGVVLGSVDAGPLEFWVGVSDNAVVQLDDIVVAEVTLADGSVVSFFGILASSRLQRSLGLRFMIGAGMWLTAGSVVLFGFLDLVQDVDSYIGLAFALRITQGAGTAL